MALPKTENRVVSYAKKNDTPWENRDQYDRAVVPERLDVLEFRGEVAFEIVLDYEDAEEIGIAAGAEDVPRESGEAKRDEGDGMKEAEGVAPALGEERPEKNGAAGEDDGGGTFGEYGQAKEETEKKERERSRSCQRWLEARAAASEPFPRHRDVAPATPAQGWRVAKRSRSAGARRLHSRRIA